MPKVNTHTTSLLSFALILFTTILFSSCGSSKASTGGGGNNGGGPGPSISFTVDKNTITAGDLATLTWSTQNATSVSISPALGEDAPGLSGTATVSPTQTTTYTLTANGTGGTSTATVTITVNIPVPTITLTADPTSILSGQSSTLQWNSTNATTVTIDNGIGAVDPTGTKAVSPTATTTYTATATNSTGTQTASATVTVGTGLAATITANPTTITDGQSSTLTWSSQGAATVTLNGASVGASGTTTVNPTSTATYTLIATDSSSNSVTATATVTVLTNTGLQNIKHIIFYMNENRSFDNYFGQLGAYRASKGLSADVDAPDLNKIYSDAYGGQYKLFHIPTTCIEVTSPGWNESHFFSHYKSDGSFGMDYWVKQQTDSQHSTVDPRYTRSLGYYTHDDLPFYYDLATDFATSDSWHSSIMAPTIPNRMYMFTGTSFGFIRPDSTNHAPYTQKTIFQLLNEHNISWKYYYQSGDVFLAQFSLWSDPASQGRVRNISEYYNILASPNADSQLPQVVFIEQAATLQLNEHPDNKWGVQMGAANTERIVNALMNSSAWPSSVFILTYDEAGGLQDHASPLSQPAPDSTPPNFQSGDIGTWDQFTYSGFRVPMVVVSPWVKKNYVSHVHATNTAILKFIETRFNLPSLTARDANDSDMLDFFDFSNPSWMTPPTLPVQPWYCDQSDKTCQAIVQYLGPPTSTNNTCDLTHKSEVDPKIN
ncbi:MAG TPA: alkaline phosphatase family protein [Terriglobales bacterium]|nr:alkaline phosphatase family protein [Terriglobales bacterium]